MAKLHGAKPKSGSHASATEEGTSKEIEDQSLMFRDPKDYEGMTMEERKKLTEQMKLKHKGIQFLGGGKNG